MHLKTHKKNPCAIHIDHGKEFVNENLQNWCNEQGIDIQMTAPYSPLQNGVMERMNHTLIELACAMLTASKLPEFLWEPVVAHTAYLQNWAYTTAVKGSTPY